MKTINIRLNPMMIVWTFKLGAPPLKIMKKSMGANRDGLSGAKKSMQWQSPHSRIGTHGQFQYPSLTSKANYIYLSQSSALYRNMFVLPV